MAEPAATPALPAPVIDQMTGMARCTGAMFVFNHAKAEYTRVMEQLEKDGFTAAYTDESKRSREEYSRVIKHPLMREVHTDVAKKVLNLARMNGGIYNKAAQFVASLQAGSGDTGIPIEYVEELRACTDQCPPRPLSDFVEMFKEDFGKPWEELFESIEEKSIGAASLAQVHKAVTKDGRTLALKFQYPGLRDQLASDFFVFRMMSGMLQGWTMGVDLNLLLGDFEASVTRELAFLDEAKNAETTRQSLRHNHPAVYVPATVPELCSNRILCMEFVDGLTKLRPDALQKAGLDAPTVRQLVCDTFAEMACCHGRVHGDPHAGNVYARQLPGAPRGTPQLVLLDHGLYHVLEEEMRIEVCRLLLACARRKKDDMTRQGVLSCVCEPVVAERHHVGCRRLWPGSA
eukprot:TRINITY_DN10055_c0_g1_i2.p1 TRINITY_DN10055_c0_g1~~TRINITY_DN10055_c0_g1_i2.p1  ORF type:complete len:403 (+),score=107.30 TRINITY_DN10055_c0_g1_i2:83-1291(+)